MYSKHDSTNFVDELKQYLIEFKSFLQNKSRVENNFIRSVWGRIEEGKGKCSPFLRFKIVLFLFKLIEKVHL